MKKMKILSYFYMLIGSPVRWKLSGKTRRKYIIPKRLTLKGNPAIYCWIGIVFSWDKNVTCS